MKVRIYKNTSQKRWGHARLPIRQRLLWLGPLFILVQRPRKAR